MQLKPRYGIGKNSQFPQILVTFIGSIAGVSHGMLFSWNSPSIPELIDDDSMQITLEQASYFTIIAPIGIIISAPLYSICINRLGRQKSVLIVGIPQLISWIVTGLANNVYLFYVARFLSGIGDAGLFAVLPLYISEISEPKVRGYGNYILVVFMGIGKFLVNAIGGYTSIKITAIIGGIIALIYIILAAFLPESPYYLVMQNRQDDARKTLSFLRWRYDTDEELVNLKANVARQISETGTYCDLVRNLSSRRALIIAVGLRLSQQFCGINAFEAYSQYMFEAAGSSISGRDSATIFTFLFVPVLAIVTCFADKVKRRVLTIFSALGCALVLGIESVYFAISQYSNVDLSSCAWIPLAGMALYVLVVSPGLILMPLLMQGELFSVGAKAKASGVITMVSGINILIVPKLFQTLASNFGMFTPFTFFFVCAVLSTVFCYTCIIETKGKTLEEIQQELRGDKV